MTDKEFRIRLLSLPGPPFHEEYEAATFELYEAANREQKAELLEIVRGIPKSERLTPEQGIGRALHSALQNINEGAELFEAPELRRILASLEYFLPSVLSEIYPHWKHESIDGFFLSKAEKTGPLKAEFEGVCILISDQTTTPFSVLLNVSGVEDKIDWLECRLGRRGYGEGNMERVPWPKCARQSAHRAWEFLRTH